MQAITLLLAVVIGFVAALVFASSSPKSAMKTPDPVRYKVQCKGGQAAEVTAAIPEQGVWVFDLQGLNSECMRNSA